ncbi:MAG: methyl-accepting chemotaxis protein [bacterium]|jgi:hypothetical protein
MLEQYRKYLDALDFLNEATTLDTAAFVTDTNHVLKYVPGRRIDLKLRAEQPIEMAVVRRCLAENRKATGSERIDNIPVTVCAAPIRGTDGSCLGSICTVMVHTNREELLRVARSLTDTAQAIGATASQYAVGASQVASAMEDINRDAGRISETVRHTDDIVRFILDIAEQTNILGLNASIEAARAGENGRGFAVVADEVRKLALSSGDAVAKITDFLEGIETSLRQITDSLGESSAITEQQAAAAEEISASIEELSATARALLEMADACA